ncbi:MAG TPA: hypothetical protein VLH59_13545 [Ignavibacteriaceae bacterium]|nr:hypothetical protein [Ignavibacteriaceae bacterium]
MTDEEIKNIIKDGLTKNKLQFIERNLRTILIVGGLFLTIFGVAYPIFISLSSSNRVDELSQRIESKVDKLIERIENRVDNLESGVEQDVKDLKSDVRYLSTEQKEKLNNAENRLDNKIGEYEDKFNSITKEAYRKPLLICLINGQVIGEEIKINIKSPSLEIKVYNQGDGIASNIKAFAFIEENEVISFNMVTYSDLMEYIEGYSGTKLSYDNFTLDPKQSTYLQLSFGINRKLETVSTNVILRFLYGQPEPTEYRFKVVIE